MEKINPKSSLLSNLVITTEAIAKKKIQLSKTKAQLLEAKEKQRMDEGFSIQKLETEWGMLETEIDWLEGVAKVMRKKLVENESVVAVSSSAEMKVVNELRLGIGAGAGGDVPCFTGNVYVPEDLAGEVLEGIQAVARTCETF